jgi:3-methyl-2-oxobutanoate hydroxymethyltransferase
MSDRVTAPNVRAMKSLGQKVVCITAYDAIFGRLADSAGVDLILVGDSAGNTVMGHPNVLKVSVEDIAHHTAAVARGVKRALLVADLPFGSYQESSIQAVHSAVTLVKAGAQAVKLEGDYVDAVQAIRRAGIPVMGHVGMTPQSVHTYGGFKMQGRGNDAGAVIEAAKALDEAGVFALVLELIPSVLASEITAAVSCPTIGIAAGVHCDGEIQIIYDILGFSARQYRHTKPFINGSELVGEAIARYASEVREGAFPGEEQAV